MELCGVSDRGCQQKTPFWHIRITEQCGAFAANATHARRAFIRAARADHWPNSVRLLLLTALANVLLMRPPVASVLGSTGGGHPGTLKFLSKGTSFFLLRFKAHRIQNQMGMGNERTEFKIRKFRKVIKAKFSYKKLENDMVTIKNKIQDHKVYKIEYK